MRGEQRHVCIYALLPNKQEATYECLLRQVQALTPGAAPTSVIIDFERAALNALDTVYPATEKKGCLFHLSKAIYRRVQSEGLQPDYENNVQFRTNIRSLAALAFVPVADIQASFDALANNCGNRPLLDYFEATYVVAVRWGQPVPPILKSGVTNIYYVNKISVPNSDNIFMEGHHIFHPNFESGFSLSVFVFYCLLWIYGYCIINECILHLYINSQNA